MDSSCLLSSFLNYGLCDFAVTWLMLVAHNCVCCMVLFWSHEELTEDDAGFSRPLPAYLIMYQKNGTRQTGG